MGTRSQRTRKSMSVSSMIGQMAYAYKRGEDIENTKPYSTWLNKITKQDIKDYAEFYGYNVGNVLKINMISIIAKGIK